QGGRPLWGRTPKSSSGGPYPPPRPYATTSKPASVMAARSAGTPVRAGSKVTSAVPGLSVTVASVTPGTAFNTRVTLATHPPQFIPCTFIVIVSIGLSLGTQSKWRPPPLEHQRVADHRHGARGHRRAGNHRIQHPDRRERDPEHVVSEREKQVLPDLRERRARQQDRIDDRVQVVADQRDIRGLDGDVRARADRKAHICRRQRRRIVDAVAHHA